MDVRLVVGQNIARLRAERKLSQAQLVGLIPHKDLKISQSYLSKVERGEKNLTIVTLAFIAHALGVKLVDLVGEPKGASLEVTKP